MTKCDEGRAAPAPPHLVVFFQIFTFFGEEGWGYFYGWSKERGMHKMSEQNRLMYVTRTVPEVNEAVWIVPRAAAPRTGSTSCPESLDGDHTPCLQVDDEKSPYWNRTPACFVGHSPNRKMMVRDVLSMILSGESAP